MRLRECLRESDTFSRLGGDQFGIILENLQNPECASKVAGKIQKTLAAPYQLAGGGVQITSSIGISYYPDSGTEAETLVQNAARALKIVKSDGRNGYQLFRQTQTADLNI
jgi:diguanylate cyclase (GGDEF)-like protein